jgi:TonB family protein
MKKTLLLALSLLAMHVCAQDTLYYDSAKQLIGNAPGAKYIEIIRCAADNPQKCSAAMMLIDSNRIVTNLRYADYEKKILHGRCSYWAPDGKLVHEIMYENGKKHGEEKFFYATGAVKKTYNWDQGRLKNTSLHNINGSIAISNVKEEPGESVVEPSFPGGEQALFRQLSRTVVYPESMMRKGIDGSVVVTFMVEADGKMTDIKVISSPHKELSEALLKAMSELPSWIPAVVNNEPTRAKYTLPFQFKLF